MILTFRSVRAGDLFDPLPAMQTNRYRNDLVQLVPLEQEEHDDRRNLPPERRHSGERYDDAPHADQIHLGAELGVAAAADDAVITRHLVRGTNRRDGEHQHELTGILIGCLGERAAQNSKDRRTQNKDQKARA